MYSVVACTPSVSGSLDVGPASDRRDAKAQYGAYRCLVLVPAVGVPAEPLPSVQRRICLLVSASWRQFSPSHPRHTRAFCRSTSFPGQ
jgi:hypothetical protein